ncbi:Lrp/AsnC family transcriptional regulator [Novosphingobium sp. P6W]|uniref:Lrp/AsnC family transcriptional regulator n=1 Tax=Novosphingobium sp. P6W TaxID=1609758 RepID=UPI0005C2C5E6|nr:Lrp/AsnC family transcriptional regulator [Novosphingobium sp. P6W]AXB78866.1 Lrp/AsnC family transcriptional regulator [Novosphingobium sp. P6W]KIS30145.1 AsnC family transcriptional regulator [Novosphingobium sp. P6W]
MRERITLDLIDRRIISALQEDGALSIADLAERLGMTPPPCWRRVRRLKDAGVLTGQVWLVDPEAVGLEVTIYATVKLAGHDARATAAFREEVKDHPEILECYILLGSVDALLKIIVPDVKYFEKFLYNKLSQMPGVRELHSSVILTEVKKTNRLPLECVTSEIR